MKLFYLATALLILGVMFFTGYAVVNLPFKLLLVLIIGFIISVLTIIRVEIGLFVLIFVVPFTQQLTLGAVTRVPFDIGTDDVLIMFILLSWLANLAKRKELPILKTSLNWPLVAFFAAGILSFIGADARFGQGTILLGVLHLFKFYEYVLIYFIVISVIDNVEQIKKFLWMFFIVVGFILFAQFISMLVWGHFSLSGPLPKSYFYIQTMHAFQSNAILGSYYAFFLSILIAMILEGEIFKNKVPPIVFAAILSFALFNTFSRSSYLGVAASFFVFSIFKEKRLFLVLLLLLVFSPIYMQSAVLERITMTVQALRPTIELDPSAAIRLVLWKRGIQVFLNNAVLGTGYWTTRWALPGEAHSQYLAVLIETGIVGFSMFCWLIVRMLANSITLLKNARTHFLKALGLGYTAGFVAILTTCVFSETLEAFRMVGPLWFVTGLVTSANRLLEEKTKKPESG